jgi:hypothetical protein
MPITTLMEAKTLLQIPLTEVGDDPLIDKLIHQVQERVVRYCNNSFLLYGAQVYGTGFAFVAALTTPVPANAKITDSGSEFVTAGFVSGADVKVRGSIGNDGIYAVKTVAAGTLTLEASESLEDETAGRFIVMTRIRWPKDIVLPVASLIRYYMEKSGKLVTSETLPGGYTAAFKSEEDMLHLFDQWRKPYQ